VIVEDIRKPFAILEKTFDVTTSIGIAFITGAQTAENATTLLIQADAALYAAKTAGRNSFRLSSD